MPTQNERIKAGMAPAIDIPSSGAYEALIAGSAPNRQAKLSTSQGFQRQYEEGVQPNVFSTFALLPGNEISSRELWQRRIENPDEYQAELQQLSASVSRTMGRYFDKSSWVGTALWDVPVWMGQGVGQFGINAADVTRTMPDTIKTFKTGQKSAALRDSLSDSEFDNVQNALSKAYYTVRDTQGEFGVSFSPEQAVAALAIFNVNEMTGKDGKPLTQKEKEAVSAFQEDLLAREQVKRNQMAKAFFQTYDDQRVANMGGDIGMGATTAKAIGNFAGDALASMGVFMGVGLTPRLAAISGANKIGGTAKKLFTASSRYKNLSSKATEAALRMRAVGNKSGAIRNIARARALQRNADTIFGYGKMISNNLPRMVALGSMTGGVGVFSQAFLLQANDTANELLAKGADWKTAFGAGIASGIAEGGIETLVGFRFLNKFLTGRKSFTNFLMKAVLPEGFEEASQNLATEAIVGAVGMNDKTYADIAAETLYAFAGGALGGAFMAGANYTVLSQGHNKRVQLAMEYERGLKERKEFISSNLSSYGEQKKAIRQKWIQAAKDFRAQQKKEAEDFKQKTKEELKDSENAQEEAALRLAEFERTQQQAAREMEANNKSQMREELAAAREQFANTKTEEGSAFTKQEEALLEQLRGNYEEAAERVNPDITAEQLENGWKGVRQMLLQEGYTGEFTEAVSNTIDHMISFAQGSDESIKAALQNLSTKLGLTQEEESIAARLTSKDEIERYNAQLDAMENSIVEQFRLAGAEKEGKAFAKIFRNQIGYLPMFAIDANGQPMTPLAFYNAVKPHIINAQNAALHNERVPGVNNLMNEAVERADDDSNYLRVDGATDYVSAYDKYASVWEQIAGYENIKDDKAKKEALVNINLALFDAYNYTSDIGFIKDYINNRALKEGAIIHEMGLDYGSDTSEEDLRILALMRQKGLSFAFSARAVGFVQDYSQEGRSERELNDSYQKTLNDLYPSVTEEDKIWLNRIAKMKNVGKEPAYRGYTVDEEGKATFEEATKPAAQTEEQLAEQVAKEDIAEEEGQVLEESVPLEDVVEQAEKETGTDTRITSTQLRSIDQIHEAMTGETSNYIAPNSLYAREGKTILVINGQNQGEFLHEAGHYLITEFLLQNMEMANIVGDKAYGPINELLVSLYDIVKGNKLFKMNAIQKQETILDAVMDFIRTDGKTGNLAVDTILGEVQNILSDEVMHPDQSKYALMTDAQKASLREAIRNLFVPTTPMQMLADRVSLEKAINNKSIEEATKLALSYMDKYALPDMDFTRYMLENQEADYITKRAALERLQQEINLQAVALLMGNTDTLEMKAGEARAQAENISEDEIFYFRPALENAESRPVKLALEGKTAYERGQEGFQVFKEFAKHPLTKTFKSIESWTQPFRSSLVEVARKVTPELGNVIQEHVFEKNKRVQEGQSYGKLFIDTMREQNGTALPITQEEYDKNFTDALNNMRIEEARDWLLGKAANPEIRAKFQKAFDGMIRTLDTLKHEMQALEVNAHWIADGEFFPRAIADYSKFSEEYLRLAEASIYSKIVDETQLADKEGKITREQSNYAMQRMFAQMAYSGSSEHRVGFLQNRVIREVTPEMRQYYKQPIDAYMDYVEDAATTILTRQLIGAQHDEMADMDENQPLNNILKAGAIFRVLQDKGLIYSGRLDLTGQSPEQIAQIKEEEERLKTFDKALRAYITRHKETGALYRYTNDILTVTMLGHFSTALSQGQEMITTAALFGLKNTANAAIAVAKGKATVKIEDLGIEELEEVYQAMCTDTMGVVANGALKLSGFKMADVYFKNVALNAIYNYFEGALKEPGSDEFNRAVNMIEKSFKGLDGWEQRVATLMEDIKNKKLSDDIKYLMYDVFANQQPINAANIAYGYNASTPLGRLCLYKFNTVAYKQLNAICGWLKNSWTSVDAKGNIHMDPKRGMAQTLRFIAFLALIGIPLETIKDLLNGNAEFNPKKSFIFSAGQCFLLNEYDAKVLAKEGLGSFIQNKAAAPLTPLNWISQDVMDTFKGDYTFKTAKGIPLVGRGLHSIIYALHNSMNDGSGYDYDFLENDMSQYWWG